MFLTWYLLAFIYEPATRKIHFFNNRFSSLLGYSSAELINVGNQLFISLLYPSDYADFLIALHDPSGLSNGNLLEFDFRMLHRNGEWRWMRSLNTVYLRSEDGKPLRILGVLKDITI